MNRRTFLRLCGGVGTTAVAGCTSPLSNDTPPAAITPIDIDQLPKALPIDLSIDTVDRVADEQSPAQFRITMTNTDRGTVAYQTGHRTVFSGHRATNETGDAALLLLSKNPKEKAGACWKRADAYTPPERSMTTRVRTDDSMSVNLYVWGSADASSSCIPRGKFRFEQKYQRTDTETPPFTWGFTLFIEDAKPPTA